MAILTNTSPIKLLLIGDSSSGKTGALASLAASGYNLRIIDIDKGSNILHGFLTDPTSAYYKKDSEAIKRVDVVRISDSMRSINGILAPIKAGGWQRATKLLMDWDDGESKLGPISSWGENDILVIDSLKGLARLAHNFHLSMNGALGKIRTGYESQRDIGAAQNYIKDLFELLYDDNIRCNVIVICHIKPVTDAGGAPKIEEGQFKGIPQGLPLAIGRAASPEIPSWFNNMLIVHKVVQGNVTKHKIFTKSQYLDGKIVGAKTSSPLKVKDEYDLAWGLADFFADMRK